MKNKILKILFAYREDFISGEKLSEELGVSRTAIWKHINTLREEGYDIKSIPRGGYQLIKTPDILSQIEIQRDLNTQTLGKEIVHLSSLESTNNKAKDLALQGAPEGLVVISEEQTKGRGRRGRQWSSPRGTGIWMSILLRPNILPREAPKFTLLAAVAVAKGIREVTGLEAQIKWPNDILIHKKKICGILTEMSAELDSINYIIIGIGMNVNEREKDFPLEIQNKASSLALLKGEKVSRRELVTKILENLEEEYLKYIDKNEFHSVIDQWKNMSCTLGAQVKTINNKKEIKGIAVDIKEDGALIIQRDNGEIEEIFFGDVSIRGIDE